MNTATITALITGITGLVGAVTTLIIVIVHVINHQPIGDGKPAEPTVKPSLVNPHIVEE